MTTKTQAATTIYNELLAANDPNIRKKFIDRCINELGMSAAGAGTYYQNTKKKVAGEPLPVYGKQAKRATAKAASAMINDDPWSIVFVVDDTVVNTATFIGEQAARDAFDKLSDHDKETSEVIQGGLVVGSTYVIGG